jgi:non-specific serine/threonine protein kinase
LNDRLSLLISGPRDLPARQQTLQAAIDWSYALLSDAEQRLFRWLGVFQGGCTIEAVEMVCDPSDISANHQAEVSLLPLLESLQDKNLLQSAPPKSTEDKFRYSMLETIHEYASYKLHESDEATVAQQRHLDWCLQLAEQASQNLRGPDQLPWLKRLDQEVNNVRKALLWCVEHPVDVESGLQIAADLRWFWHLHSHLSEGCEWLDRLLAIDLQAEAPRSAWQAKAQAMRVASALHGLQRNRTRAMELAQASHDLFSEIGDPSGVVSDKIALSAATCWSGDVHQGAALAEEMLQVCRANGDRFDEAELLDGPLSAVAFTQGNYARAAALHEQSLALRCALHDTDGEAWSLFLLARSVSALGDMERSRTLYEESRALWRQLGNWREYANVLDELGRLACRRGDNSLARALFEESLTTAQSIYDRYRMARALCALGMVACGEGDFTQAQASLKQMMASVRELQDTPLPTMFFITAARLACMTGPSERAARLAGAAETALSKTEPYQGTSDRFEYEAVLASIRLALSEEVFDRARAEGRAMSLNAALACATDEALS